VVKVVAKVAINSRSLSLRGTATAVLSGVIKRLTVSRRLVAERGRSVLESTVIFLLPCSTTALVLC